MAAFNGFSKRTFCAVALRRNLKFMRSNSICFRSINNKITISKSPLSAIRSGAANCTFYNEIKLFDSLLDEEQVLYAKRYCNEAYKRSGTSSEIKGTELSFQDRLQRGKKQAESSVLIGLSSKEDVPQITLLCQEFGNVKKIHTYTGESNNVFFLVEFSSQDEAKKLLQSCYCKNASDAFPIFSRLVKFERNHVIAQTKPILPVPDNGVQHDDPRSEHKEVTVSQLIEDVYLTEKLTELDVRLRFFFCTLLRDAISGLFPYSDVIPFGSSVNGVGKRGCDLDVMIRLQPEKVGSHELYFLNKTCLGDIRILQQKTISCLGDLFRTFLPGVNSLQKVIHARVPILKFRHRILGIDCDVSINNMSAVYMSELLYFYGDIDARVRPLVYAVKKWAKDASITYEAPGTWITNFSLTLLVLFFLQNRPQSILPPLNNAVSIKECRVSTSGLKLEYMKDLSHWTAEASCNTQSLAELLLEFFTFLATFPFGAKNISVLTGQAMPRNPGTALAIQYPFEENKNVSQNVSDSEMEHMCSTARTSIKYLGSNMLHNFKPTRDFVSLLGVQTQKKQYASKIDVGALLMEDSFLKSKRKTAFARKRI